MNKVEITIKAPTQSGKSIMMDRIEKVLVGMGCRVHSPDLELERCGTNFNKPLADWERDMLSKAIVELKEVNIPRSLPPRKGFGIQLEFKPQDLWIGAFWQRSFGIQHLWICLIPMLPIHLQWTVGGDR